MHRLRWNNQHLYKNQFSISLIAVLSMDHNLLKKRYKPSINSRLLKKDHLIIMEIEFPREASIS